MAGGDNDIEEEVRAACLLLVDRLSCRPADQKEFLALIGRLGFLPPAEVTLLINQMGLGPF